MGSNVDKNDSVCMLFGSQVYRVEIGGLADSRTQCHQWNK